MLSRLIICHLIDHGGLIPSKFGYTGGTITMSLGPQTYNTTKFKEFSIFSYGKARLCIDARDKQVTLLRSGKVITTISIFNEDSIEEIVKRFKELI